MTDWPTGVGAPAVQALAVAGLTDLPALVGVSQRFLAGLHGMGSTAVGILAAASGERGLDVADAPRG